MLSSREQSSNQSNFAFEQFELHSSPFDLTFIKAKQRELINAADQQENHSHEDRTDIAAKMLDHMILVCTLINEAEPGHTITDDGALTSLIASIELIAENAFWFRRVLVFLKLNMTNDTNFFDALLHLLTEFKEITSADILLSNYARFKQHIALIMPSPFIINEQWQQKFTEVKAFIHKFYLSDIIKHRQLILDCFNVAESLQAIDLDTTQAEISRQVDMAFQQLPITVFRPEKTLALLTIIANIQYTRVNPTFYHALKAFILELKRLTLSNTLNVSNKAANGYRYLLKLANILAANKPDNLANRVFFDIERAVDIQQTQPNFWQMALTTYPPIAWNTYLRHITFGFGTAMPALLVAVMSAVTYETAETVPTALFTAAGLFAGGTSYSSLSYFAETNNIPGSYLFGIIRKIFERVINPLASLYLPVTWPIFEATYYTRHLEVGEYIDEHTWPLYVVTGVLTVLFVIGLQIHTERLNVARHISNIEHSKLRTIAELTYLFILLPLLTLGNSLLKFGGLTTLLFAPIDAIRRIIQVYYPLKFATYIPIMGGEYLASALVALAPSILINLRKEGVPQNITRMILEVLREATPNLPTHFLRRGTRLGVRSALRLLDYLDVNKYTTAIAEATIPLGYSIALPLLYAQFFSEVSHENYVTGKQQTALFVATGASAIYSVFAPVMMWFIIYLLRQFLSIFYGYDIGARPSDKSKVFESRPLIVDTDPVDDDLDLEAIPREKSPGKSPDITIDSNIPSGVGVFDAPSPMSPTGTPAGSYSSGNFSMKVYTKQGTGYTTFRQEPENFIYEVDSNELKPDEDENDAYTEYGLNVGTPKTHQL